MLTTAPPFFAPPLPRLIAHRGASGIYPENTLAAFEAAVTEGVEMIELDVHLTGDGIPVVIHDSTLARTTGTRGLVGRRSWVELGALDAGFRFSLDSGRTFPFRHAGHRIPALIDVLRALPQIRFILEIKSSDPRLDAALNSVLEQTGAAQRVMLASFNGRVIRRIRRSFAGFPTNFAPDEVRGFVSRRGAVPAGARALQVPPRTPWGPLVTRAFVEKAHGARLEVHVWTINAKPAMHALLDMGVDGIMTDFPERLLAVYRERGLR
jgi:glycerophosphoryl diester phosphodiesterase